MDRCAGDSWTGLTARAAAAWDESSRLIRCARRTAAPWYEFQELRYARNRLWARLAAERRSWRLPDYTLELG